jgi:hemerythrin
MLVGNEREFATEVARIDAEHKELFSRINALRAAAETGKKKVEIWRTMDCLESYAVKHFAREETLMEAAHCSACRANKLDEDKFLENLRALRLRFDREGTSGDFLDQIDEKIEHWIETHIKRVDVQMHESLPEATT